MSEFRKEIKDEMEEDEKPLNQENAQPQGSITKGKNPWKWSSKTIIIPPGTPNRQRSTLIGSLSEAFDAQAQPSTSSSLMNTITNEMNASQSELINEKIVQGSRIIFIINIFIFKQLRIGIRSRYFGPSIRSKFKCPNK